VGRGGGGFEKLLLAAQSGVVDLDKDTSASQQEVLDGLQLLG
jgi:hypothetical protein